MNDYWSYFVEEARAIGSALYENLALNICGDEDLKALAALSRPRQPHANMLLGAVHFLLLRGAIHPLRDFYPTLGGTRPPTDKDLFPAFRDFVARHRSAIEVLVSARVTNTNEVGRSAILHPGFQILAREIEEPLHLVELGPSAGLNLIWDRYGVRYKKADRIAAEISPHAALMIACELKGDRVPPSDPVLRVATRLGLELNPVDLGNPDDRDWLRALIWPDQVARLTRLDRALEIFMADPPHIRAGDAIDLLPAALAGLPPGPACVMHTIMCYQLSTEAKQRLDGIFLAAGRPLFRLGFESDGAGYGLVLRHYRDGASTERGLARAHPHGTWMEWQG